MKKGESSDDLSLADALREGAACALRGLLEGNEQQIIAAEEVLRAAEETLREGLRHLGDQQAEEDAQTGLERARLAQALASALKLKGLQEVPEETQGKLWTITAELRTLGPQ